MPEPGLKPVKASGLNPVLKPKCIYLKPDVYHLTIYAFA